MGGSPLNVLTYLKCVLSKIVRLETLVYAGWPILENLLGEFTMMSQPSRLILVDWLKVITSRSWLSV